MTQNHVRVFQRKQMRLCFCDWNVTILWQVITEEAVEVGTSLISNNYLYLYTFRLRQWGTRFQKSNISNTCKRQVLPKIILEKIDRDSEGNLSRGWTWNFKCLQRLSWYEKLYSATLRVYLWTLNDWQEPSCGRLSCSMEQRTSARVHLAIRPITSWKYEPSSL